MLGNAMQGLHSLLPVYMEKIPCRVHTGSRQLETKTTGCQNSTHNWVGVASAHLRSKRGCILADVSPGRVLSMNTLLAKTTWNGFLRKVCSTTGDSHMMGEELGTKAIASIIKETQEP